MSRRRCAYGRAGALPARARSAARGGQRCGHCGALHNARLLSRAVRPPPKSRTADGALGEHSRANTVPELELPKHQADRSKCGSYLAARGLPSAGANVQTARD
eukprot:scaffold118261_cov33-Phaeocystis_antarctica.AAC.1